MSIRVAFSGSRFRFFKNMRRGWELVRGVVESMLDRYIDSRYEKVVVGHGSNMKSVDGIVHEVAQEWGLEIVEFKPRSWTRRHLLERNMKLAKWCDVLVAIFVDYWSPGTMRTCKYANLLGKRVRVIFIDTEHGKIYLIS